MEHFTGKKQLFPKNIFIIDSLRENKERGSSLSALPLTLFTKPRVPLYSIMTNFPRKASRPP